MQLVFCSFPMMPKARYLSKFNYQWLDINNHPSWTWLKPVDGDNSKACCTLCKTNFDVSNMGISSVTSHEKGKKHRDHCDMKSQSVDMLHHFVRPTSVEATLTVEDVHTAAITATSSSAAESTLSKAEVATAGATSSGTGTSGQQSVGAMRHFLVTDEVTRAEIIWALHGVIVALVSSSQQQCN